MTRPMTCRTARECLGEYLDQDCPEIVRERLEAHLLSCRDCSRHLSELEYVELRLRKALVPMEPSADFSRNLVARLNDAAEEDSANEPWGPVEVPPESFTASVMGRIQEEFSAPEPPSRNWKPLLRAGMLVAAGVLVLLGVFLFRGGLGHGLTPEEEGVAALFQVEAVEGRVFLMDAPSMQVGLGLNELGGETPLLPPEAKTSLGSESQGKGPKGRELREGSPIPVGKELFVQGGEARIRARPPKGGSLSEGWSLLAAAGSKIGFEVPKGGALRATLRRGQVRVSGLSGLSGPSEHENRRAGGEDSSFYMGFPGGGGVLLRKGKAEIRVSEDPWARATGLPEGASRIQVDLEEGEALLLGVSGEPLQTLLPGDRALMRPFEPLRIVHRAGAADLLSAGKGPGREPQSPAAGFEGRVVIQGQLRTELGAVVSARRLRLALPDEALEGATGPDGSFRFAPRVDEAVLGAFLSVELPGSRTWLRFELPPLRPGNKIQFDLRLPRVQGLRVWIRDAHAKPMPDARLRAFLWEPLLKRLVPLGRPDQRSGPTGRARLVGLPRPKAEERILLVVEPRNAPLFVAYLDRSAFQRLERDGGAWSVMSPPLLRVLLEAPGFARLRVEERPQGPARDLLLRRRAYKLTAGRVWIQVPLPAPKTIRWWTRDARELRVHEGRLLLEEGKEARVVPQKPDRLQVQVLNERGEGLAGRPFVLVRRRDNTPVFFGETDKSGFATLLLADPRASLELRIADSLGGEGRLRSFDLPRRGDLLVARLSFGRITVARGASQGLGFSGGLPGEGALQGLRLLGKGMEWRPLGLKRFAGGARADKTLGGLELSLSAGGGARVVPSARVYLLSGEGGLAFLGTSDLLGQLRVEGLPTGMVLRILVVHGEEGEVLAEVMLRPGEMRRLLLELHARTRVQGNLPTGAAVPGGSRFVEVEVLGGPFAGTRTVAIPDEEGRIDLPDLPAGSAYRFRYETYEARLPAQGYGTGSPMSPGEGGEREFLKQGAWKRLTK
ncbi:MAG TPA: zf-HC2 domain-containing protein [Planctomycetes bacterium]|nr:zf-HC2 domain-containing protein [Planctomycetota bacterium]